MFEGNLADLEELVLSGDRSADDLCICAEGVDLDGDPGSDELVVRRGSPEFPCGATDDRQQ